MGRTSSSSTYSLSFPSSGSITYTTIVITMVSLGYFPEDHTCVISWVLLRENWVAEFLLEDMAESLDEVAEVDDG